MRDFLKTLHKPVTHKDDTREVGKASCTEEVTPAQVTSEFARARCMKMIHQRAAEQVALAI